MKPSVVKAGPTPYAKRLVAQAMYVKGANFIGAAMLVRERRGYEYVVLHLLCQGLEITLKAALLYKDFGRYHGRLRKLGHNLVAVAETAVQAYGQKPMASPLAEELARLAKDYGEHTLRYGGITDIFIDPASLPSGRVLKRTLVLLRLMRRQVGLPVFTL